MTGNRQEGISLIEVMVSMTVGLIIMATMFSIYVTSSVSNAAVLSNSKLNQELSSLMLVMSNDIRRAGYWGTPDFENPQNNPFSQVGNTALVVVNDMTADVQMAENSAVGGECILYTYDSDNDGVVDNEDIYGFRLNNGVVQMRQQGDATAPDNDSCTTGTWLDVTDGNMISVTALNFNPVNSQCLNTDEPNGEDDDTNGVIDDEDSDCYANVPAAGSGAITVETRQIDISFSGNLVEDAFVTASLQQEVRVRNDLVRLR